MPTVKIPPVLRASVGGSKELQSNGSSVGEVLRAIADSHPSTRAQLFAADGTLNRYVNVYLNDEDVRVLDGLGTAVSENDTLVILPAMAGGALSYPQSLADSPLSFVKPWRHSAFTTGRARAATATSSRRSDTRRWSSASD